MPLNFNVKVEGVDAVRANLRRLPLNGRDEARKEITKLSRAMANKLRAAVRRGAKGRMGTLVAPTIRAQAGLGPGVLIGPQPVLFGTEFGARGRYGWYSNDRYQHSLGRQFLPRNKSGYWFQPTIEREKPAYDAAVQEIVDGLVRRWGA